MRHCGGDFQPVHLSVRRSVLLRSGFSHLRRYPELRDLELRQLAQAFLSTDSGPVLNALKDKIKAYTRGHLSHAKDVLPALYELMERGETPEETPTEPPAPPKQDVTGGDWKRLKDALTWSLTSGSFLDSQVYALDSEPQTGVPTIRPIYFCSMVGGNFLHKVVKCKFLPQDPKRVVETYIRFVENLAV